MTDTTTKSLGARGLTIFKELIITKDFSAMPDMLSPSLKAYHDDNPVQETRDEFLDHFRKILSFVPDFTAEIIDHVAQVNENGKGGKVWIFSRVSGLPGGVKKDSVDMMEIDDEGLVTQFKDVQRAITV